MAGSLLMRCFMPRSGRDRLREYNVCLFRLHIGCNKRDTHRHTSNTATMIPGNFTFMHDRQQKCWKGLAVPRLFYLPTLPVLFFYWENAVKFWWNHRYCSMHAKTLLKTISSQRTPVCLVIFWTGWKSIQMGRFQVGSETIQKSVSGQTQTSFCYFQVIKENQRRCDAYLVIKEEKNVDIFMGQLYWHLSKHCWWLMARTRIWIFSF